VTVSAPALNVGAGSPLLIVFDVVSAWQIQMFPAVEASARKKCVTVPQLAVAVDPIVIVLLFEVWPPVPLDAVVLPALCVPAQFVRFEVTDAREYAVPDVDTSVTEPVSQLEAAVARPTYSVAGAPRHPLRINPRTTRTHRTMK
jgi:hypothetical protein